MANIATLPQLLVNKIAAGEVVERPASVVKELLENSLDAGAKRVAVDIEDGGKRLIRISDDGCGIAPDQLPLAVAPHATSKIAQEADLYTIASFGFRGEALASIASVSQVDIVSRQADAIEGAALTINGGDLAPTTPAAGAPGTTITVQNLFFNTPARRKFLRRPNTEMGHISEQFTRVALANPDVHLTLSHNGRLLHELPAGASLRDRVAALFSRELAQGLLSVARRERDIEIDGLIGLPQHSRPSSQWQYVFLNGRCIRDRFISHALREAYRGLMEPSRQPVVFLFLRVPAEAVDVNVHPAKTEVRFADSNVIHSQVLAALRDRLLSTDLSATYQGSHNATARKGQSAPNPQPGQSCETETPEQRRERVRRAMADFFKTSGPPQNTPNAPPAPTTPTGEMTQTGPNTAPTMNSDTRPPLPSAIPDTSPDHAPEAPAQPASQYAADHPSPAPDPSTAPQANPAATPPAQPGELEPSKHYVQIHNSYLVTESDDGMVIVDQHALHERIIYERLHQQVSNGTLSSQRLLIPETVDVTANQMAAMEKAGPLLESLGVLLEPFGPRTVAVQGFPTLLERVGPAEFVGDLLDLLVAQAGKVSREQLLHELLDMMACKAAVKAGDPLTQQEIEALLAQGKNVDRASNCPHGRPTSIKLSLAQLEKQFKRT